jgi:hypothetical protein
MSNTSVPPLISSSLKCKTFAADTIQVDSSVTGKGAVPLMGTVLLAKAGSTADVATLTADTAVDGYTPVAGDVVLLAGQTTDTTSNGLWVATGAGGGAWSRTSSMQAGNGASGTTVYVTGGTGLNKLFVCTSNPGSDVVGTSVLTFATLAAIA